jgi:CMP/dCMP kinase
VVVTISNLYGCGALAIAKRAADELGYEYVDEQLPVVVAKRLQISPDEVEANQDPARTFGERWLNSLELATPELAQNAQPFGEQLLQAVQDAVREYAGAGNVVLIGRGAGTILGNRPDVLRVFMYAPRDWRIVHIADALRVDKKTAEREIDRIDRARSTYLRDWYGATFGDPGIYDLCLDTSRLGELSSAALIVQAVRQRSA